MRARNIVEKAHRKCVGGLISFKWYFRRNINFTAKVILVGIRTFGIHAKVLLQALKDHEGSSIYCVELLGPNLNHKDNYMCIHRKTRVSDCTAKDI